MGWVELLPGHEAPFRETHWDAAETFLAWTGVLVNRHRDRQVEQVRHADGSSYYLKKQFAVTWRERLRNAWDGFGWCATAVREAATLQALRRAGIGCPDVVALGEAGRSAFVLLRDESDKRELRAFLPTLTGDHDRASLAAALGRDLARLHNAGFDHPDLFAKHILAARSSAGFAFSIIDWQRSRHRRVVPWRVRVRDLAVLDATLHASLASDRLRLRCLRAYRAATTDAPPLRTLTLRIRDEAARLRRRRGIREIGQLPLAEAEQRFVPFDDGRLLVVQSCWEACGGAMPPWLKGLRERQESNSIDGVRIQSWPATPGMMPALAHTLFRMQRFGVRSPRLLAVGWAGERVFAAMQAPAAIPFATAFAEADRHERRRLLRQAGALLRKMHDAGYGLAAGEMWATRLGVAPDDRVLCLCDAESLVREDGFGDALAAKELAHETMPLSWMERRCFLLGYAPRRLRSTSAVRALARRERQVAA